MPEAALTHSPRPPGRPIGFQRWRHLAFFHWTLPPEQVRPLVPSALALDLWEGEAWVGLVPFTMRDVAPWWSPSMPWVSHFHELNLRTYVTARDGSEPGVWFFSLEAARLPAVLIARLGWALPYHWAAMSLERAPDGTVRYHSRRRLSGPATFEGHWTVGDALPYPAPGSLEHFLAERYTLYAQDRSGRLRRGRVHHAPYPLRALTLHSLSESIRGAAGLDAGPRPGPGSSTASWPRASSASPRHAIASDGVDVDIYPLERVPGARRHGAPGGAP